MEVIFVMFVLIAAASAESCQPCPTFWVSYEGNCYRIFADRLTWSEAEIKCKNYTARSAIGHLVSIRSQEENEFVSVLWNSATDGLVTRGSLATYWIGLTNTESNGWLWSDNNEEANYTNWDVNQPDNYGGFQNCATVWNRDGLQTKWDDTSCYDQQGYVCKISFQQYD
ncbi:echinoidin-like [Antedon mediterranea]|uniref:echinoidin-like n=1 Tax=Antedon mediterranea TaxID=105859 RepID=UPI003AF52931